MREKLKERYSIYEGSTFFIESVFDSFEKCGQREKSIRYFIDVHFRDSRECDLKSVKRLAAYWNNIAFDKLNQHDFMNYKYCVSTVANYRMIAKQMEQNDFSHE
jgi:hypothetical protein